MALPEPERPEPSKRPPRVPYNRTASHRERLAYVASTLFTRGGLARLGMDLDHDCMDLASLVIFACLPPMQPSEIEDAARRISFREGGCAGCRPGRNNQRHGMLCLRLKWESRIRQTLLELGLSDVMKERYE